MGKRVIVIAEGEMERRVLPCLLKHLLVEGVALADVRVANGRLTVEMAQKLVISAWFAPPDHVAPDKFVVLCDADGKDPREVLQPFRDQLPQRVGPRVRAALQFACAQWHLEAWYFADESGLRAYLGGALGGVDASSPDHIQNPRQHLKQLLGERAYTAVTAEEIAKSLDPQKIANRSPTFKAFLDAVRNGHSPSNAP